MDRSADARIRARLGRASDDVAARAAVTAPGLRSPGRRRPSLAPLGAALALAAAIGLVGAVLVRHGSTPPVHGRVVQPGVSMTPAPSATPRPVVPTARGAAVSADVRSGALVFGGFAQRGGTLLDPQSVLTNDTWHWDGRWTQLHPPTAPSPREGALMVLDPATHSVLLFGGDAYTPGASTPTVELSDTWTWGGTTWTRQHPRHQPTTSVSGALVAFDATAGRVLMLDRDGQTWTWDGSDWTLHHVTAGPNAGGGGVMAWDPVSRTVILEAIDNIPQPQRPGCCGNPVVEERTWSWSGSTWVRLPSVPAGMVQNGVWSGHLATDGSVGLLGLLPRGTKAGPEAPDVLHWDGNAWLHLGADPNAPFNSDGLIATANGLLLSIDLSDYYEGDHSVEQWTDGHWVVRE